MARTTKTTKKSDGICPKQGVSKKSAGPSSISTLQKLAAAKKKQYLHSDNTTGKYNGYVARGKEWLASFSEAEQEAESKWKAGLRHGIFAEGEDEINKNTMGDPNFCNAFDGPPVECTPQAITMFLAWKCFAQDNGQSTADGIHAAFLAEYNEM
jgi:hypothetical protein